MKWISVEDELPPLGREVNCYCPSSTRGPKVRSLARYIRHEGAQDYYWDNYYGHNHFTHTQDAITHWMHLPEPPTKEE